MSKEIEDWNKNEIYLIGDKMGIISEIKEKPLLKRINHKLFYCPTFWTIKPKFKCPLCGRKYRCYWDGNDTDHGINLCNKCANKFEKQDKQK